ncbi:MAG TPA: HDIG domain-containing protein [Gemmatimonadales bacterium]
MTAPRRLTPPGEPRVATLGGSVRYHGMRWLPLVILAAATYALYPVSTGADTEILEVGAVARADVVAPFAFEVRKSPAELTREGDALAATVRPIYVVDELALDSIRLVSERLFDALDGAETATALVDSASVRDVRLTPDEAAFLMEPRRRAAYRAAVGRMVRGPLTSGVAAEAVLGAEAARVIVVRRDGSERVLPRDSAVTYGGFLAGRSLAHPAPSSVVGDQVYVKLLIAIFRPTLFASLAETEALRNALRADVDSVKDVVQHNERIIAEHEVVTTRVYDRLVALRNAVLRRGGAEGRNVPGAVGQMLTNALILSIFWLLLMLYRRETYDNLRELLILPSLFGIVLGAAAANYRWVSSGPELIPIPFAAMLITVLYSGRVAMVSAAVLAVLIASQSVYDSPAALYIALFGGVAAAIGIRVVRRRSQILVTMAIVSGVFAVAAITVGLQSGWPIADVGSSALRGTLNAVVSAALVSIALPVLESLGGMTTDLTLLELSDPSRPLLRRLATEAPGTYAHSIAVANLCEAACNAVGANGLLARVGCYYHDVGKVKKPHFFVENQSRGANPHDRLKPDVSASIIRNHVKEGLALADEAGLPSVVKAFIPEHHGTAEITYFLDRARAQGAEVPEADRYRYPGPKPRSVETGVAMLADGVEAALRVLDDPAPQRVRDAIEHIVRQRIDAGQLSDAPLTLAQLDRIKDEFARVLSGVHHNRIDYPVASGGIAAEWDPGGQT